MKPSLLRWAISFFTAGLPTVAVPVFFAISGYLLYNGKEFGISLYKSKLVKRWHTLIVPYLIWNVIALIILWIGSLFMGDNTSFAPLDFYNKIGQIFLPNLGTNPPDYPLWFMRDLIYFIVFSPVIYWLIKHFGKIFIIILTILYITGMEHSFISVLGLFYFSIGMYINQRKIEIIELLQKSCLILVLLYLIIVVVDFANAHYVLVERYYMLERIGWLYNIELIFGSAMSVGLMATLIKKEILGEKFLMLANLSFTVYATHGLYINIVKKLLFKILYHGYPVPQIYALLLFMVCVLICMITSVFCYDIMKKNRLMTKYLLGGRI